MKLLFVSSSLNPLILNSGKMGGIEINIRYISEELIRRGHQLEIIAPTGSVVENLSIREIPGQLQPVFPVVPGPLYNHPAVISDDSVLTNMWDFVRQEEENYDLILDFDYEWLPFYLSPFLRRPILHYLCMSAMTGLIDREIARVARLCPGTLGVHTQAQAQTYSVPESLRILGGGIDITKYDFCPQPGDSLAWAGRITPYKGLEDAVAAANATGINLKIFGRMEKREYWEQICQNYPNAPIEYMGFLPTEKFQTELGKCRALLMTHKWVEGLGRVALEALACGVPIISYRRGGPEEIVVDGKTGWLVEPDSIEDLIAAMKRIDKIDRNLCRGRAETEYSLPAHGDRLEQWFQDVLH